MHNMRLTWNHDFVTTMSWGQEMLLCLGQSGKEKVRSLELQNTKHDSYKKILTTPRFLASRFWREYPECASGCDRMRSQGTLIYTFLLLYEFHLLFVGRCTDEGR